MTNEEIDTTEPFLVSNQQDSMPSNCKIDNQVKIDSLEIRNVKSIEFQRSLTQVPKNGKHTAGTNRKTHAQEESKTNCDRIKTSRFNEPRNSALGTRKLASSRMRTSLNSSVNNNKSSALNSKVILCTEESEREMWVCI